MKIMMPMVLRHDVTATHAAIACAHGALAGYLKWRDEPIVQQWVSMIFYKRIYKAADLSMWNAVKEWRGALILTESKLDNLQTVAVFIPRVWSNSDIFNELPLYG